MVSYITSFFNYLFPKNIEEDASDIDKDSFLAEQILNLELTESIEEPAETGTTEIPRDAVCFQRTGIIKYMAEDYILIDGMYYFDTTSCTLNLNVNDKVVYLAYVDSNESLIIVRILESCGTFWGDNDTVEEDTYSVKEHIIVGEVDYRDGRFVYVKDSSVKFNLDNIQSSLVPIKGDWLEMLCNIKYDEEKPSDVSTEQVLEVISIKPLRTKIITSAITDWTGEHGICDRHVYFNRQCLNGVEPTIGCKALIEAIESSQGTCTWRAIKMNIIETKTPNVLPDIVDHEEELSLDVEAKNNIEVTFPLKFEKVNFNQSPQLNLNIANKSDHIHVINKWIVLSKKRDSQIEIGPLMTRPRKLYPGQSFCLTIKCLPKFYGNSKEHLIIMFKGFQVRRTINITITDDTISAVPVHNNVNFKYMADSKRLEGMRKIRNSAQKPIMPGQKVMRTPNFVSVKLGMFTIPDRVWGAVLGDSEQTAYSSDFNKIIQRIETQLPCLIQDLSISNYIDRWHVLLYMEEIQANINIRSYDVPKVFLIKCQEYLGIEITGLAEKRPSLIKGDRVIVKDIWNPSSVDYEGFIHMIKGDLVLMKFCPQFHESYSGSDVSIEFHFARTVFRRCHQAINLALSNLGPQLLFPTRSTIRPSQVSPERLENIEWFNKRLNTCQKRAVINILLGECRPLPYCIYGPPGTGKTITVVETILQILTLFPDSRILIATPSNSSANLITERLLQYKHQFSTSVIRLIANYLLDSGNIPDEIKPFCATLDVAREDTAKSRHIVKDGINLNCQSSFIGRHRVTIGTCNCLGSLAQLGLPKGHFTHVIVDEAGQATEPEIMIPLTFIDKDNGQIVLAGDPMQLGPIVISKYCMEFGMDESYLCRILETFPYQKDYDSFKDGFNDKLVTKLIDNYRSLEEVIQQPSEMFYDDALVAKIDREQTWVLRILDVVTELFDLADVPKTGGIFVHGIRGSNLRAEDSPSWLNPQEASMVALTTCKLYKKNIDPNDIGIITPYIAQVKYIRLLFDAMGLPKPKIGSVEEFQGQERRIIIISTVRSSESLLGEDQRHSLGFVKCPKRLNVALTRAQVAVLLFCDPHILSSDPLWLKVIKNSVKENKYMGCDLPFT